MSFHDVRFPVTISLGATGGPRFETERVLLANGYEERNSFMMHPRRHYDAGSGVKSLADLEEISAFFYARSGELHSFRWRDWSDYQSAPHGSSITAWDQKIGIGDGISRQFQLIKTYHSGAYSATRVIDKPTRYMVKIAVDDVELQEGSSFEVDHLSGVITFHTPPTSGAPIMAGYEFDVAVRFDTPSLDLSLSYFNAGEIPSIPIVEVLG